MSDDIQVAVYYFPNYHVDPRNEAAHGEAWTEWELVRRAEPRFPGHDQPKVPAWGYEDEADPVIMALKIDAAADHGVDCFIFDWYHYEDGPFLERALEQGFMRAPSVGRVKFALMWANHDWINIHPAKLNTQPAVLYPGVVDAEAFDRITNLVIERHFAHPSYWRLDGCPYFSVYDLGALIGGLGGLDETRAALARFREKTVAAGHPGLNLNVVVKGYEILPGEDSRGGKPQLLSELGFDSATSYVWVHHVAMNGFPTTDYAHAAAEAARYWPREAARLPMPYFPNVTMGWDASPRTVQSDAYVNAGYPFGPTLSDNTPERFREALTQAKAFVRTQTDQPRIVTINAWNEWTEGSYLEPDTVHGMAYLEAVRDTFGTSG